MTIRYEIPRIEDLGSLVELTASKPKFGPQAPAYGGNGRTTREDSGSFSGTISSGFSGLTTDTN